MLLTTGELFTGVGVGDSLGVAIGRVGAAVGINIRDLLWTHFGVAFEFAVRQVRTAPVGRLTDKLTSRVLQSCPIFWLLNFIVLLA